MQLFKILNYDWAMAMAYIIALQAYALLILGALAVVAGRGEREVKLWLALFGFCKGAGSFSLFVAGLVDRTLPSVFFTGLYLLLVVPAYWAAACFAWKWLGGAKGWKHRGVLAVLWSAALGAGAAVAGERGVDEVFRWLIVVPAGAGFIWSLLSRARAAGSGYLLVMAAGVAGLMVVDLAGRDYYTRFQGWTINTLPLYIAREGVVLPFALGAAGLMFLGGWRWLSALSRKQPASYWQKRLWWGLPVMFVMITAGGVGLLSWTNSRANARTDDLFMVRVTTASLVVRAQEPEAWGETLRRIKEANPDVEGVYFAEAKESGLVIRLAAVGRAGLGLPAYPYIWQSGGEREERFWGAAQAFHSSTMTDAAGAFKLACHPWPGVPGGWLIFRMEFTVWDRVKGPILVQATAIIGLATGIGVAILIYQLKREEERDLRNDRERAEAVARARGESLAFLSHELRTPLQSVIGYADLLGLAMLADGQRRHLGAIQSQGRLLLHLVNDFLDLAAFEAGRLAIQPRPVRLQEVVRECVEAVRPRAEAKGLKLGLRVAADVPAGVRVDEARMQQVLGNLLGNAVKFTAEGSVRLAVTAEGADVVFEVADTGPGISEERKTRLFQPFERGVAGVEGTGLGLALTRRLCTAMGGTVELVSTPGRGAVFTVRLPLERCAPPEVKPGVVAPTQGPRVDVLVVDDHPLIRELLVTLLQKLGHRPVAVASGEEALDAFAEGRFDVAMLDLNLEGIDGIETARRLRDQARLQGRGVRLIGLSAEVSPTEQARARAEGFEVFLVKPVPLVVLAELLPPAVTAPSEAWAEAGQEEGRARWRATFREGLGAAVAELRQLLESGDWEGLGAAVHHLHNGAIAAGDRGWQDVCARLAEALAQYQVEEVKTLLAAELSNLLSQNSVRLPHATSLLNR